MQGPPSTKVTIYERLIGTVGDIITTIRDIRYSGGV